MIRKFSIAFTLVVILTMVLATGVLADNVGADSDIITPGNQGSIVNLTASPGTTVTTDASLAVDWAGSKHLNPGDSLTLVISNPAVLPAGSSVSDVVTTVPSDWGDTTIFNAGKSTISFTAPSSAGSYTYALKWDNKDNTACSDTTKDCLNSTTAFTINLTVEAPADTTPPTLHLPENMNVQSTGPSGAVVTYTATADDTAPAHPTVTCNPASGSTFGFGTTTVNCSAKDTAGNTANGSFSVTVADSTKPVITYELTPAAPDGSNGWYKSSVQLVWAVSDPDGSIISSSGCGDIVNVTTDTLAAGTDYTCSATSTGGDNSVTVNIKRDATAPTVTVTPDRAADHNGWYNHSISFTTGGTDTSSGIASCSEVQNYTSPEGTGLTVNGSCTDNAGNVGNGTSAAFKYDATAPKITAELDKDPDSTTGWYNIATGAPTVSFTCSDGGSGLADACPADDTFLDGANQSYSKTIYDLAGNSATAGVTGINVDLTAPTISARLDRTPDSITGWYNIDTGAPTVSFTCGDDTSGIDVCPAAHTFEEGANQPYSDTAFDKAGNSATAGVENINVDLTAPTLNWIGGPADGASYYFGFDVPDAPTCEAADALSGPNGCSVTGYSTAVGSQTMTATAFDVAGNSASESRIYTVLAWTLKGFYQPVDMNEVLNVVKNGSTVPLKFEIFAGPTELKLTSYVSSLVYTAINCDKSEPESTLEAVATGGTSLRFDPTGDQFIFNWKTPNTAGNCYRVTMTTLDGSSLTAYFKLK